MRVALSINLGGGGLFLLTVLKILSSGSLLLVTLGGTFSRGSGLNGLLDSNLDVFGPFLNQVSLLKDGDLVKVVFYLELELNLAATLYFFLQLFASADLVFSDINGKSLENFSLRRVLNQQSHVAELVVKSDGLLEGEHASSSKDLLGVLGTVISKTVLDANGQCVVFLNDEAGD